MNDDILQILKMVESHKLSPEEGEKLISALGAATGGAPGRGRFLHIHVAEGDQDKVNVKLPFALAKTLLPHLPRNFTAPFAKINVDEILQKVENTEGDVVNVESGKDRVRIWVE